jgi:hypothetical protein
VGQKLLSNSGLWAFVSPVSTRGTSCTCLSITSNMNNVIHTSLWDDSFDISEICQCFVISSSIHWVLNSSLTVTRHWTPSYKPNFSSFTIYLHPWANGAQCSTTQLSLYTTSIGWWIWLGVIHSVMAHRLICTDSCTAYHSISPKTAKRTPLPFPHTHRDLARIEVLVVKLQMYQNCSGVSVTQFFDKLWRWRHCFSFNHHTIMRSFPV